MIARLELDQGVVFLARPETVGTTDEEIEALENGTLSKERDLAVANAMQNAANYLVYLPAEGRA